MPTDSDVQSINDNLEVPAKYRPIPKAHLFLHRLRKINIIDRQIRQKWVDLQKKKIQQEQKSFKQILQVQKLRQATDNETCLQKIESFTNKVARIRSDIIREEAGLRKKLYDEVYFKKNKRHNSPNLISNSLQSSQKISLARIRVRTEEGNYDSSPLIVRRRTKAMQKELNVIQNRYEQSLKELSYRKYRQERMSCESQKKMLRKYQGQKFYYLLASS